jgi:hypothetical protein
MYSCTQHPALMYPSIHTAMDPGIRESMQQGTRILYMWPRRDDCGLWDVLRRYGDLVITFHQIDFRKNCVTMQAV